MSNKSGLTLLALVTGAVVGAGLGILFAPDKGTKTRQKMKKKYNEAQSEIKNKYDNLSEELKTELTNKKTNLEEGYEELLSDVSHKAEDVISFLENKLAELKAKNAKLQK